MVPRPEINTILYATDLGEQTRPVFRMAVSQARRYDARILMMHVVPPLGSTAQSIVDTYLSREEADKLHHEGMHQLLETMKVRLERFKQDEIMAYNINRVPVTEIIVVSGSYPCHEILRVAEEHQADMIVMGKSTHSFFHVDIMGTTARRVTRYSRIPVLLVPNNPVK
ncbi:MAG: universal stress protein [Desulfobulbus sp.]|nr:universal stress protein [Desulfobulbus sp.]